ncbi:MAG TPA: hypothetical protein VFF68_13830, partial [Anaerolineaceae bacterium]|nr:hypothetical protein [Anaerolineaceae bacterium]
MFPQIFNLLTTAPGNLVYHLVLAFSIVAALQAVILQRRPDSRPGDRRLILSLLVVLVCQVALFLSSGLAWQGLADPQVFLPPLDRAVTILSLIWIAWIWVFPSASRPADAGVAIFSLAVIVALLLTFAGWGLQANTSALFNNSIYDYAWTGAGLAILFAATALLVVRRPNGWGIGLGFMLVNLAGFLAHLLWGPVDQNFSGLIRLAQLSTYPLLPTLARQFAGEPEPASTSQADSSTPIARRQYSADPRMVQIWLDVATDTHQKRRVEMMLQAITRTMLADLGLMIAAYELSDGAVILNGFDLIRE